MTPRIDTSKSIERDSLEDPQQNEFIDKIGAVETNQHEAPLETIPEAKILCCLRLQVLLCRQIYSTCVPHQRRKRGSNILIPR